MKKIYNIDRLTFSLLYDFTEFMPNSVPDYDWKGTIDFNKYCIETGRERIYFDCLSENDFIMATAETTQNKER